MTITEISAQYGVSTDTLRYYERIGLIPNVGRTSRGVRDYAEADCKWVEFAICMRSAGIPIEALIEYVSLFAQGDETNNARKSILIEQRMLLAGKIEAMQETLARLDKKIAGYDKIMRNIEAGLTETTSIHDANDDTQTG